MRMLNMPETNAKGWHKWAMIDVASKDVLRIEYKPEKEVDEDNKRMAAGKNFIWVLFDRINAKK